MSEKAPPFFSLDVMMTIYRIGFEHLDRRVCGPWTVPISAPHIFKLHNSIAMADIDSKDEKFFYMSIPQSKFLARFVFYKRMGFGLYNL
jgi:hypothetical protein